MDTLTTRATVSSVDDENGSVAVDLDIVTVNQDGEPVVNGYARLREWEERGG